MTTATAYDAGHIRRSRADAAAMHSGRSDIEFTRLACDADDVARLGLTGTAPKKNSYIDAMTGQRVPWTGPAVEIEAISPPMLRRWLDDWIVEYVDPEALRLHQIAEDSGRQVLTNFRDGLALDGAR